MLFDRKFNQDSKNVLKTIIFSLQLEFTGDFISACPLKLFLAVQILIPPFILTILLNKKFNKDSKNVLKTVIFSLQVGFIDDFVPDCSFTVFLAV